MHSPAASLKPQDLPQNLKHLLQLVATEASQSMGAGAGNCTLAPAQPPRPSLDHH